MKFSIGSYKVHIGKVMFTATYGLPEFSVSGPLLWIDIDWTDARFPVGWCAGMAAGRDVWRDGERGPQRRWRVHWSWNAPYNEPNRINITLGPVNADVSCFTWWKTVDTGVTEEKTIAGKVRTVHHVRHVRCFPYLADGWPVVRFFRIRWRRT